MRRAKPSILADQVAAIGACVFMGFALLMIGWYTVGKLFRWW